MYLAPKANQKSLTRRLRDRLFRRPLERFRHDLADKGRSLLVRMDLINRCNMRCFMCPYSAVADCRQPAQVMPPELFERVAGQIFPYAYHAALSCAYEPLMHPQFERLLEIAVRRDVPEWGIVTNASLMSEPVAEAMIRCRMTTVSVSLDGVRPETYRDIRGVDAFDKVLGNVRRLQEMKKRAGSVVPHLFLNFVMMRCNVEQIVPYLELCRELGAEDVTFVHVMPRSRDNPQSLIHDPEQYAKVYAEARQAAERGSMRVLLPAPFTAEELAATDPAQRERRLQQARSGDLLAEGVSATSLEVEGIGDNVYCASPWMMVFISPDGAVHPCSHRQNDPPFGNLADSSFERIWNGRAFLELRRRLYYHDLQGICRRCESATPNSEPMVRRPVRIF